MFFNFNIPFEYITSTNSSVVHIVHTNIEQQQHKTQPFRQFQIIRILAKYFDWFLLFEARSYFNVKCSVRICNITFVEMRNRFAIYIYWRYLLFKALQIDFIYWESRSLKILLSLHLVNYVFLFIHLLDIYWQNIQQSYKFVKWNICHLYLFLPS